MLLPIGIWFLSVVFGTYLGYGLFVQLKEKRVHTRWYVWEPDEKRTYILKSEQYVDYWGNILLQIFFLGLCIYGAMVSV